MDERKGTAVEALLEQLIAQGPNDIAGVFARAFELAMELERERFLRAGRYERTTERQGYANGYKPKRVDTPAGSVTVQVPKTAGHGDTPFYPQSLERGRRSVRAVMLAVAEMYIKGVSTRDVEAVMAEFGIESLSSSQVSRATKLLDEDLQAWRDRPLGEISFSTNPPIRVSLNSTAGTGHFYVTKKNARTMTEKMTIRKYDPVARKHVEYKEGKIK